MRCVRSINANICTHVREHKDISEGFESSIHKRCSREKKSKSNAVKQKGMKSRYEITDKTKVKKGNKKKIDKKNTALQTIERINVCEGKF